MEKQKLLIDLSNLIEATFLSLDEPQLLKPERKRRRIYKKHVINLNQENDQSTEDVDTDGKVMIIILIKLHLISAKN